MGAAAGRRGSEQFAHRPVSTAPGILGMGGRQRRTSVGLRGQLDRVERLVHVDRAGGDLVFGAVVVNESH